MATQIRPRISERAGQATDPTGPSEVQEMIE